MGQIGQILRQALTAKYFFDFINIGPGTNDAGTETIFLPGLAANVSHGRPKFSRFSIRTKQPGHLLLHRSDRGFPAHQFCQNGLIFLFGFFDSVFIRFPTAKTVWIYQLNNTINNIQVATTMDDTLVGCVFGINFGPKINVWLNYRGHRKGVGFRPGVRPKDSTGQNSGQDNNWKQSFEV